MNSKLREQLLRLMRYSNTLTPHKLDEPLDPFVDYALSDTEKAIRQAVGEEMLGIIGEDECITLPSKGGMMIIRNGRLDARDELRAELRQKIKEWQGGWKNVS